MKKLQQLLLLGIVLLFMTTTVTLAQTEENAPANAPEEEVILRSGFSTALLINYGFEDPYSIGTGLRIGYIQENGLSITGTFLYNFGTGLTIPNIIDASFQSWQLTGDVGYNFRLPGSSIIWRPQISAGIGEFSSKVDLLYDPDAEGPEPENKSRVVFIPAIVGVYPLSTQTFIGAEIKYFTVLGASQKNALGFAIQTGFRL